MRRPLKKKPAAKQITFPTISANEGKAGSYVPKFCKFSEHVFTPRILRNCFPKLSKEIFVAIYLV